MSRFSSRVQTLLSFVTSALLYAGLIALAVMTVLVLVQVVCRDFFDLGLPGADELARFFGMALVFLAVPRLLLDNGHIAVDLVRSVLHPRGRAILDKVNGLLMLLFCGIMLVALYKFLLRAGKFATPALGIPNLVYYLPAVLGIVFFALVALHRLFAVPERSSSDGGPAA